MINLAYAQDQMPVQAAAPGAGLFNFLPIILIFIIFYFMVFRPQKKSQDEHARTIKSLKKNDEIVTSSGIHGTVVNIKEDTFVIRVDEGVRLEIDKSAVARLEKKKTTN